MATPKFLSLSSLLRRSRPLYNSLYFSTSSRHHHYLIPSSPPAPSSPYNSSAQLLTPYNFLFIRSFSSRDSVTPLDDDSDLNQSDFVSAVDFPSVNGDGVGREFDFASAAGIPIVGGDDVGLEESILPVRALISLLDGYHDLTGFPWWVVIASSTVAFRLALFPFVVLQLQKLKRIAELFHKLPPPFPPPHSGRSLRYQLRIFQEKRKELGCPSFSWFFAPQAVQLPLFLLGVTTIRRMALNHHPGFDTGGILWFQNLTQYPNGVFGPVFPLLIAGLWYINVQVSLQKSSIGNVSGLFGTLAKYYKKYCECLTIPLLIGTFNLHQGPLIYWLINGSSTLIQQLVLKHPHIRKKLGLPDKQTPAATGGHDETAKHGAIETNSSEMQGEISLERLTHLSPKELVALSVKFLAEGHQDRAIPVIRLALDKDPQYVRALLIMGQIFLQQGLLVEATQYMERAISKLLIAGHPTEVEDDDLLILSSMWAGSAYIRQGKNDEGMVHLQRLAGLKEPVDAISKVHYYEGLLLLSSALYRVGCKAEAREHLRRAVDYDPDRYKEFLEQCENDEDNFVEELANSRRADL